LALKVKYQLNGYLSPQLKNQAFASSSSSLNTNGTGPNITSSDSTDAGSNVDANNNGNPDDAGEYDPTYFGQQIALLKSASALEKLSNGAYRVRFIFRIKNLGPLPATNLQITDPLKLCFTQPASFTISSIASSTNLTLSNSFNGQNKLGLLSGNNTLTALETASLGVTVDFNMNGLNKRLFNSAVASTAFSVDSLGSNPHITTDTSDAGSDFDPNNNGNANEGSENQPTGFGTQLGLAKRVLESKNLGNGTTQITFEFKLNNLGIHPIVSPEVSDRLDQVFAAPSTFTVNALKSNGSPALNANYNGIGSNAQMLANNQTLSIGESYTWSLTLSFNPNGATVQKYKNSALAVVKDSLNHVLCQDSSDAGDQPDSNNNGLADELGENDPTEFIPNTDGPLDPTLNIPNAFSPNDDGTNDLFVIDGIGYYPENHFEVINRWGNLVYKMHGYNNTWNGSSNQGIRFNETDKLPEGTYFYILKLRPDSNEVKKGYIYLNRK
jgi:gliding motility-associated-like protein/uncharacterized repeat protein (TIGR01451 family)